MVTICRFTSAIKIQSGYKAQVIFEKKLKTQATTRILKTLLKMLELSI